MRIVKKGTGLLLSLMLLSTTAYANAPSNWATTEIDLATSVNMVTADLISDYQGETSREAFAKLLVNSYESIMGEEIDISNVTNPFLDTSDETIIKAYSKGFIKGTSYDMFSGKNGITRQEIVVMIIRMYQTIEEELDEELLENYEVDTVFTDYDEISSWAIDSINMAYNNGIIVGYSNGNFYPGNNVTKEQAIIINYRAYEIIANKLGTSIEPLSEVIGTNQKGYVTCSVLNVRSSPDTSSSDNITNQLNRYAQVEINDQTGDWYQVVTEDNISGYVHSDYIQIIEETADTSELAIIRTEIVDYALQHEGLAYVYGGNSLETGTDCSGFVQLIYKEFGYDINRTASTQANNGSYVDQYDLLPGDLVFYGNNGSIQHVAMYIGDGQVIHEGNSSTGVFINDVFSSWNKPFVTIRRIVY